MKHSLLTQRKRLWPGQAADQRTKRSLLPARTGLRAGEQYTWDDYLADQKACYQNGDQTACARSYYSDFT